MSFFLIAIFLALLFFASKIFDFDGVSIRIKKEFTSIQPIDMYLSNKLTRDGIILECQNDSLNKCRHLASIRKILKTHSLKPQEITTLQKLENDIILGRYNPESDIKLQQLKHNSDIELQQLKRNAEELHEQNARLFSRNRELRNEIRKIKSGRKYNRRC